MSAPPDGIYVPRPILGDLAATVAVARAAIETHAGTSAVIVVYNSIGVVVRADDRPGAPEERWRRNERRRDLTRGLGGE
jgi:hypothetical protein